MPIVSCRDEGDGVEDGADVNASEVSITSRTRSEDARAPIPRGITTIFAVLNDRGNDVEVHTGIVTGKILDVFRKVTRGSATMRT